MNDADGNPEILRNIYGGLAAYYIFNNKHDSAFKYNDLYKNIIDTIYSTTSLKQINELQTRYETEQKEMQVKLLSEKNRVNQLSIVRKNIVIGIVAGSFIIALILGFLFYKRYKMKQQAILQEEVLKQQQMASKAVISAEELERQRIASDLHDGIGQMFSVVKMNLSSISDHMDMLKAEDRRLFQKTLEIVDESCKELRVISHQMMPDVLLQSGLVTAVWDFMDKIDDNKIEVTFETSGLEQPLDPNIETVLYRIIQESVNNVIKHANATQLDIQLRRDEQSISATIEDNGVGFEPARLSEQDGIGLKNVKARVAFLSGTVDYATAPGKGTLVAICIPNNIL